MKLLVGARNKGYRVSQDVVAPADAPGRWLAPLWPPPYAAERVCGRRAARDSCLFNLSADPGESASVSAAQPELFARMLARVDELQRSVYSPDRGDVDAGACEQALGPNGGYWGPWLAAPS